MKSNAEAMKEACRQFYKPTLILTIIYAMGISAILRANFNYIDDMGRAFEGYRQFGHFGRYISSAFSILLHADAHLTDISPLPQLLAAVILAISGVIVLYLITGRKQFGWIEYVAAIPLGLSPYFLECISYKFDSPYMAFSILVSVAPLLLEKRGKVAYFLSIVFGMLGVCMSYQAASGIFPMLVAVLALKRWNQQEDWKSILRFVVISAVGYLIGMLIFAVAIMKPVDEYVSNSILPLAELLPITFLNLKKYYYYVFTDFKKEWLLLFAALCAGFVYVCVRESRQKWYLAFAMSCAVLLMLLGMAFGLYPVLANPLYAPRAMYGFGVFLAFIGIYTASANGRRSYVFGKIACFALCWCFFVFSFTYGNALYVQKTYTDYRICAVIDDLDETGVLASKDTKTVQITGSIGMAPGIETMRQDCQILNRLVPVVFGDSSWIWGRYGFDHYYGLDNIKWDPSADLRELELPIMRESIYHTIRADSDYVLIELKP